MSRDSCVHHQNLDRICRSCLAMLHLTIFSCFAMLHLAILHIRLPSHLLLGRASLCTSRAPLHSQICHSVANFLPPSFNLLQLWLNFPNIELSLTFHGSGVPAVRNEVIYDCCPEPYLDITFVVKIRRRTVNCLHCKNENSY